MFDVVVHMSQDVREPREEGRRLSYKFRLYPNKEQERYFSINFGCCRYVYNHFLAARIDAYERTKKTLKELKVDENGEPVIEEGKRVWEEVPNPKYDPNAKAMTFYDTSKALTALKSSTVDEEGRKWLYDADSNALLYALRHLDNAYNAFFRRVKQGGKPGFPKFKSRYSRQAFTVKGCGFKIGAGFVKLPKIGKVKAKIHREVEGKIVSATISRNAAGQYYVAVNVKEAPEIQAEHAEGAVGITMGIERWIVTSDGEVIDLPGRLSKLQRKLAREQRRLSRKVGARHGEKPSANYLKQRRKVASLQNRIANVRNNATHAATRHLVDGYGVVCSRDMGSRSMMQGEKARSWKLNRAIANGNFAEVNRQLEYKAGWAGREFVLVPETTPTAQTCRKCGYKETRLADDLRQEWTCPECGTVHDRKYNGARNVLDAGLEILEAES